MALRMRPVAAALLLLAVVAGACTRTAPESAQRVEAAQPAEPPQPEPRPTSKVTTELVPLDGDVRLVLTRVRVKQGSNDGLFARAKPPVDHANGRSAARNVATRVARYVESTFVADRTRGRRTGLTSLLTGDARKALTPADLRALGVGASTISDAGTARVRVRAIILAQGSRAVSVTAAYRALVPVHTARGRPADVVQEGSMVFIRTGRGWRADAVEARLAAPDTGAA